MELIAHFNLQLIFILFISGYVVKSILNVGYYMFPIYLFNHEIITSLLLKCFSNKSFLFDVNTINTCFPVVSISDTSFHMTLLSTLLLYYF